MRTRLIKSIIWLASLLPLPMARVLGRLFGELAWRRNTRSAVVTRINIENCFPAMGEEPRGQLIRRSLHHWGMTIFEVPVIWRKGRKSLDLIEAVEGRELIERALDRGKGLILVSPHLGNWELAGLWSSTLGPMTILYQSPDRLDLDELLQEVRGTTGATLVATDLRGVSTLVKALKRGEITGVLPDMVPERQGGVFAPFFGVQALTMKLTHSLQQRTGATILAGFFQRTSKGFKGCFIEPEEAIYDADATVSTAALNRAVERLVLMAPEQYQWEYKRFKVRPPGEPPLYPKNRQRPG